jgi:hypothetical protein
MPRIAIHDRKFAEVIERRTSRDRRFEVVWGGENIEAMQRVISVAKPRILVINVSRMERDPMDEIMELLLAARPEYVIFTHHSRNKLLLKQLTTLRLRGFAGIGGVSVVHEDLAERELYRIADLMAPRPVEAAQPAYAAAAA